MLFSFQLYRILPEILSIMKYSTLLLIYIVFSFAPINANQKEKQVYVVNHGWHTGIVISSENISDAYKLKQEKFPKNKYIEFGWGDYDFYQNPSNDVDYFLAAKAAIWPTKSVMHVVGFDIEPEKFFGRSGMISLNIADSLFSNMHNYISQSFERGEDGDILPLGEGLYGNSMFFRSDKIYIFPKTCNVWTAQVLREAGLDLSPLQYQSASDLMEKLAEFGQVIRRLED